MKARKGTRNPMPSGPVVAIAVLAKQHGMSSLNLRRRLKKIDAANGGGLLFRFNDASQSFYYVDVARLKQLVPAYAPPDPNEQVLERITCVQRDIAGMRTDVAALRDNVAACIPSASI